MLNYKLKIGVLPIRRYIKEPPKRIGIFQSDYAVDNKNAALKYIREYYEDAETTFVDIEWLNDEGLLYLDSDCDKVAEYFKSEKIDALFIINCNFGQENCAGLVAKQLRVPTLLWGPRDRNFTNDIRYTDTQCGLFAMSKQLKRNDVKFSYIENCDIEAPAFDEGLKQFFGVACMVKNFKNMRILQVGARVKPFKSIMYNELELAEKFGIDVVSFNLAEAVGALKEIYETRQAELETELVALKNTFDCGKLDDETLKKMLAIVLYYEDLAKANDCNVISSECWTGITLGWGANPCLAMTLLADRGVYVTCEWDMHMTITNVLLLSATRGKGIPIQGEFTCRHPENDNAELLWHCGPFPLSYKAEGEKPYLYNTKPSFRLKDGEYTIARFQAEKGKYYLFGGKFTTCEGPKTFGTYLWAQFKDLPKLERKLIEGPYIHHMTEVPGDYTAHLKEFCKYIDEVEFDEAEA
ncbi:MAG: fucose isomerase [Clostridia bacterium]|nr:fucose isomerase [Clostridia bacterium]